MSGWSSIHLFANKCGECGKPIGTPAMNRQGDLPLVFCSSPCETDYRNKRRYHVTDPKYRTKHVKDAPPTVDEWIVSRLKDQPWQA